jgi:hypothetical protein
LSSRRCRVLKTPSSRREGSWAVRSGDLPSFWRYGLAGVYIAICKFESRREKQLRNCFMAVCNEAAQECVLFLTKTAASKFAFSSSRRWCRYEM